MLNGRNRITAALATLAVTGSVALTVTGSQTPAQAEPDIDTVKERVERLMHEAEQASERYNDARIELDELNTELDSLAADRDRQGDVLDGVRSDVRDAMITQYQGQSLGTAGRLLESDTGQFLTELSTVSTVNDLQDSLLTEYGTELEAYTIRRDQTDKRREKVSDLEGQLEEEKSTADDKLAEAEELLDDLEAEQREEVLSRGDSTRPVDVDVSGRASAAVNYAMAQQGKAYVYGAAGPSAFDCSGLTMMAWAQAGVSLPHSSSAQYSSGTRIAESQLAPGDLVFYYSPISHVGMYIGNGMIVHAANPGTGVVVSALHSMPYVGAVRPG
ncbi:C40 family peptidase [Nocardioides sambongensis]|uniref:C40 family peptidase n=1 Tax=Nocardioides sambongensis TaxID=2589074 RepID=UPI001E52F8A3|nr:C40 family peptidase [Nocardioides sambongensis]